jgi:hypothetical protein
VPIHWGKRERIVWAPAPIVTAAIIHNMGWVFHTVTPTFRRMVEGSAPSGRPRVKVHRAEVLFSRG